MLLKFPQFLMSISQSCSVQKALFLLSGSYNLSMFSSVKSLNPEERNLMETSHLGQSIPKSLTLGIFSSHLSLHFSHLPHGKASLLMAEQGNDYEYRRMLKRSQFSVTLVIRIVVVFRFLQDPCSMQSQVLGHLNVVSSGFHLMLLHNLVLTILTLLHRWFLQTGPYHRSQVCNGLVLIFLLWQFEVCLPAPGTLVKRS